jgi:hypothetical protein
VSYTKLPGRQKLEQKLSGKGSVSPFFDGRPWQRHSSCERIAKKLVEREFFLSEIPKEFLGKSIKVIRDDLAKHFDSLGYRFGLPADLVVFDAHPNAPRKNWIFALGECVNGDDERRFISVLHRPIGGSILAGHGLNCVLVREGLLLIVRK